MGLPSSLGPGKDSRINGVIDPRLQPTPDFGTLGSGSDVSGINSGAATAQRKSAPRSVQILAMAIGMIAALIAGAVGSAHRVSPKSGRVSSIKQPVYAAGNPSQLNRMQPQKQAETLLEMAVAHSPGAVERISSLVNQWQGKVEWNSQIANLTTAALNSDDMRVRESGIEVELAAYGLAKNSASLAYLLDTANSSDHGKKIWALWALGLIANRGVEPAQVVEALKSHLNDGDAESRQWAVEGLALAGTDDAIAPLLKAMHDDASPAVRERAACGLSESGMFTPQQRFTVVPILIDDSDDPSLDANTHGWAFHALSDITHQHLANDSATWRRWYQAQAAHD